MKNKKNRFYFLCAFLAFFGSRELKAQDSLFVYELMGAPVMSIQSTVSDSTANDTVKYNLIFKLNDVSLAGSIRFDLGTIKNASDILSSQATVTNTSDTYFLNYNSNVTTVYDNSCEVMVVLTGAQYQQLKWVTLFSIDKNGVHSGKQYYQVNY